MARIELNFSHQFEGTIWNSALSHANGVLVLEVRNAAARETSFSALDLEQGKLLWEGITFEEPWWIGLDAALGDVALFSVFSETSNAERKAIVAYHIREQRMLWWRNDFSLSRLGLNCLAGIAMQYGHREVALELVSGAETQFVPQAPDTHFPVRPVQYLEGHPYFATVRTFLATRFNLTSVISLEYLEESSFIFISLYTQTDEGLTNEFLMLSQEGDMVLRENLGAGLKGIGQDTFFIYRGSVIFVKNRGELFSYKIV